MRFRLLLLLAGAVPGAACSGDSTGGDVLVVSTVEVTPPGGGLTVGATLQLSATGKTSGGVTVPDRAARWSSSNATVASVSSSGLVTGNAIGGPVSITATIDRASASVSVNVTPKPVASVTVEPAATQVVVGAAVQFTAVPRDAQGQPLDGRPVSWDSEQPAIATVTTTGSAIGVAVGVATIRATSEGRVGTATLTVAPRPASRLGFTTQPANGIAGQPLGPIRVAVQDDIGGTVATATTAITLGLADNPGGATLGGTLTANAVQGVATFSDLVLDKAAAGYILRASGAPLSPALSNPFAIGAAAAAALAITTQPSGTSPNGVVLAQQPVVQLRDGLGNAVAQAGVTITAALVGATGTLGGTLAVATNASGAAVFTSLAITAPAGSYTLRFTSPGLTEVVSSSIAVAAGTAARLAVTTQPSVTAQSGVALTQPPVVQLQDASGNAVAQAGITITVSVSPGGTPGGNLAAVTNASGGATFTGLSITGPAGTYTLSFSSPGLTGITSTPIALGAGGSAGLQIVAQPSGGASSGVALASPPLVRLVDGAGNAVSQAGVTITASVTGVGATVTAGATATTGSDGIATFTGLTITGIAASYSLTFTAAGLTSVTSAPIVLGSGVQTGLVMARQPSPSAQSGVPFPIQPLVQVVDGSGNAVATAGVTVTASLASGPGTLGGTLTAVTNGVGLATFTSLAVTGPSGAYTIRFTAPGLTQIVSGSIGVGAGTAAQLSITSQPPASAQSGVTFGTAPVVQLRDGSGNAVAQAGVSVSVALVGTIGTLRGTLTVVTGPAGTASFPGLSILSVTGNRTLAFSSSGLAGATSNSITITAGPAARLGMATQPAGAAQSGVALSPQPGVQVQDSAGNSVATNGVAVTASIAAGAGGTLGGSLVAATNTGGLATFTNLLLSGASGNYTLRFANPTLDSVVSSTIVLGAGLPSQLSILTQPSATVQNGVAFPRQPVIQLRDASNNPVAQAGVQVTVTLQTGNPLLSGTLTQATNGSGQAIFTDLEITGLTGPRTLIFAASGFVGVGSNTVSVNAGPAAALEMVVQPSASAQSGIPIPQQPAVRLVDESGNAVSVSGVSVSGALTGGGTLTPSPATATTNGSGIAAFTNLVITGTAGIRTLNFASAGLTGTTSSNINLTAGAASQLTLTTPPSGTAQSGAPLAQQPVVQLRDGAGNAVAQSGVTVSAVLVTNPGGTPSLANPTATTDANGLATFAGLAITGLAGNYSLRFESGALTPVPSGTIVLSAGAASRLTLTTLPPATASNTIALTTQPVVQLRDGAGNPVSQAGVLVSAVIATGPAGASNLTNATAITSSSGAATFSGLAITGPAGDYTLRFDSGALAPVTSGTITLSAGPAATLTLETPPSSPTQSGAPFTTQPAIRVRDVSGNTVTGATVTAAITAGSGQPGATLGGITAVASISNGRATFTDLVITGLADTDYTLTFSATGTTPVVSTALTITAGSASRLLISIEPSPTAQNAVALAQQPVVQVVDQAGNLVNQNGTTVTAEILTGGGTLTPPATATTNASGTATFAGLTITGLVGPQTLRFTAAGLASDTSATVTLAAGAANTIAANSTLAQTATAGTNVASAPSVLVTDVSGNPVNAVNVTYTVASGGGTIAPASPALVATNGSGLAALTSWTLGGTAGPNSVTATAAVPNGSPVTFTADGTVGPASQVSVTGVPANSRSGLAFTGPVVATVRDAGNNAVSGRTVTATLTGAGDLLGTTSGVSDGSGQVTFAGLGIASTTLGSRTLTFTVGAGPPSTTANTTLAAGPAWQLAITTEPGLTSAVNGAPVVAQPVVQVRDSVGNALDTAATITAEIIASPAQTPAASLANATANASGSSATFSGLTVTGKTGGYTVRFFAGPLRPDTAQAFTLTAGPVDTVAFQAAPPDSAGSGETLASTVIRVVDQNGNPVSGVTVTADLIEVGATVRTGTETATSDGSGLATFSGLIVDGTANAYTLRFSANGKAVTRPFALDVGAATRLVITTQPGTTAPTSGVALDPQGVVEFRDSGNNVVKSATAVVTATLEPGTGTGSISGTLTKAAVSGVADFTGNGITITAATPGTFVIRFTAGSLTVASIPIAIP